MASAKVRFWILISLVTISGFSQGMLLPLLAIILEQHGVPSSVNGLHATGLYIGVLLASPFMEKPVRKFGFKPIIVVGGLLVFISLALFPVWEALWLWFILRVTIGIGDNMLHFGTQTWITTTSAKESRGKNIALYGLAFGLGFTLGPLMTRLLSINEALPFFLSALFSAIVWSGMFFVRNKWPEDDISTQNTTSSLTRFIQTGKIAWVALLPAFGYGFLEATLHGIFPIYGLRISHDVDMLALIIPCFAAGSIITQLPLGVLSDRVGRRKILLSVVTAGVICFLIAALWETSLVALFLMFTLAGMFVGSLFSLGISYMTDLLPGSLLPAGNLLIGIAFSIGSISGPYLGGLFLQIFPGVSFFYVIVVMLVIVLVALYVKKDGAVQENVSGR
ncbi:MFS transporter [Virgibacillus dakarensis]|uniref:MFS-type transporter YfkF n=1 Tax=Lentibacillus populi TaxID=1827502 RepID=A0A9W5U230_9BACI|nr:MULTISPECIES: MFS transporter [Bacillaceae]MBT2217708.1 MFS transporter [Virgibacillus dakarensis]MTW88192.1 MFS transporter [Virgibacillus dakarensis]GGB59734.1 putative MFS-type transporter YfkF [Lentibacillus populi]